MAVALLFIIYFDNFKFGKKFRIINSKFRSTLFKGLRVWAEPINAINYRTFLIAKRLAVWRFEHNSDSQMRERQKEKGLLFCSP